MGFYGDAWLREARDRINSSSSYPSSGAQYCPSTDLDQLAEAVEKAIKAALIENHGSIPAKHDHKNLVSICQSTGVWDVLPPALRNLVQEVESYQSSAERAAAPPAIQKYLGVARRLIDYMEYHVIGNDSVLRRLNVA